jgi:hypothetical protein
MDVAKNKGSETGIYCFILLMAGHVKRFVNSVISYLEDELLIYRNTIELRVSPQLASGP